MRFVDPTQWIAIVEAIGKMVDSPRIEMLLQAGHHVLSYLERRPNTVHVVLVVEQSKVIAAYADIDDADAHAAALVDQGRAADVVSVRVRGDYTARRVVGDGDPPDGTPPRERLRG